MSAKKAKQAYTFYLPKEVMNLIQDAYKEEAISRNLLVTDILLQYVTKRYPGTDIEVEDARKYNKGNQAKAGELRK